MTELTPADEAALAQLGEAVASLDAGFSLRSVAKLTGVSPATALRDRRAGNPNYDGDEDGVIEVSKVQGLDGKIRPSRRYDTTDRDQTIRRLRAEGKPLRTIATDVGCSVGTVHRVLAR